jgi:hypothetical protein
MSRMLRPTILLALLYAIAATVAVDARADVRVRIEAGGVWQARNDVSIPGDGGSRFALDDIAGNGPYPFARLELTADLAERHGLRLVYAPLRLSETGRSTVPIEFAGESFDAGALAATYQFNAPRLTYRYLLRDTERWQLQVGFTLLVRDAVVRLRQGEVRADDTDVGLVPLLHLAGSYRLADRWRLAFDLDGLAAPQGRAFDLGVRAEYALTERWDAAIGYRTLEGGVDSDDVYNFSWFNYALVALAYRF